MSPRKVKIWSGVLGMGGLGMCSSLNWLAKTEKWFQSAARRASTHKDLSAFVRFGAMAA